MEFQAVTASRGVMAAARACRSTPACACGVVAGLRHGSESSCAVARRSPALVATAGHSVLPLGSCSSSSVAARRLPAAASPSYTGVGPYPHPAYATAMTAPINQQVQRRHFAKPSSAMGLIVPYAGFATSDMELNLSSAGGQYARGVFARRPISQDREVLRVPAFAVHIGGDVAEALPQQAIALARGIYEKMVLEAYGDPLAKTLGDKGSLGPEATSPAVSSPSWPADAESVTAAAAAPLSSAGKEVAGTQSTTTATTTVTPHTASVGGGGEGNPLPYARYVMHRVLTLMTGSRLFFLRERDVNAFADSVLNGTRYLELGNVITATELQKLPQVVHFNRFDVEYRGRKGIAFFPEASYFNHTCDPNVALQIRWDVASQTFLLTARTLRPIQQFEELFVSYVPYNDLPLSRLQLHLRARWGFECRCPSCRYRFALAMALLTITILLPAANYARKYVDSRREARARPY